LEGLPPPLTRFCYAGPVLSGATLGAWSHEPLESADRRRLSLWRLRRSTVDLPYRTDLPNRAQTLSERDQWLNREREAHAAQDAAKMRDCRAMIERLDRRLTRLANLPEGPAFPCPVTLWRMGDAVWVMVENELYQHFQVELRRRFPTYPIVVA